MDIKELNKAQLVMLLVLLSFVVSIATSIITVSLMQEVPASVSLPINKVVRETVEKIVPTDVQEEQILSTEQQKLLEELKAIKPLTVSVYIKGIKEDKILGTGLFLGNNKVVVASLIPVPKEGENYVVKSVLGEQKVSKVSQEKDFTVIEVAQTENSSNQDNTTNTNQNANTNTNTDTGSDANTNSNSASDTNPTNINISTTSPAIQ